MTRMMPAEIRLPIPGLYRPVGLGHPRQLPVSGHRCWAGLGVLPPSRAPLMHQHRGQILGGEVHRVAEGVKHYRGADTPQLRALGLVACDHGDVPAESLLRRPWSSTVESGRAGC